MGAGRRIIKATQFLTFLLSSQPVITSSPSEDHTYSAGNENAEETAEKINGENNIGSNNGVQGEGRT